MKIPTKTPSNGFYYHYKHDPNGPIKFAPSYPRRKRFPRITSAGYEAGHRENFVGKARPTGRTIHYAAIHPRRQADGVFWPLPINNYAYEVVGVGCHTEDDCRPEDVNMVVYRPLYESSVYRAGKLFDLRPLEMWMGEVILNDEKIPRFNKIDDPVIVEQLETIKKKMYT